MQIIMDILPMIVVGGGIIIVVIIGCVQRAKERKYTGKKNDVDMLGTVGKVIGNSVFRGLPTDITGMPPSGHFQKPDFSYDEKEEQEYSKKYEQLKRKEF